MESLLFKVAAFIVAVGTLVAIHEFGHFWVARRLGVRVLRFSIGFGKPLWRRVSPHDATEYVIAAIPLGGYVKMLDEREGPVPPQELDRAFNRQSLWRRSAIVIAGPAFNFLFAIAAFWLILVLGEEGSRPLIGEVRAGSPAQVAGFEVGDEIYRVNGEAAATWSQVYYRLAAASVTGDPIDVLVRRGDIAGFERRMPAGQLGDLAEREDLLGDLGITPARPKLPPVLEEVLSGEAASQAGLRPGDRIVSADGVAIEEWRQWFLYVRERPGVMIEVEVARGSELRRFDLIPARHEQQGKVIGRIGATVRVPEDLYDDYRVVQRLGPVAALSEAVVRTWDMSVLTLKVVGRILTGQASVKNLSGPLTIADTASKTASIGLVFFLKFLAIVSISLGVLNLLPIPVLDGGHLLYFLIEAVKGGPLSEEFLLQGQRIGMVLLLGLMGVAIYVDLTRYLS